MIQKVSVLSMFALALVGCGGSDKPAGDPSSATSKSTECSEGEVREGGECVPTGGGSSGSSSSSAGSTTASSGGGSTGASTPAPPAVKTAYDKESVDIVLKRAAAQVKKNCGAASDENGKAGGPWGQTKVSITLGRNGHVHDVTIPDPYDGKPTGKCALLAFRNLVFPPYPAPADVTIDWDVELVKPGGK